MLRYKHRPEKNKHSNSERRNFMNRLQTIDADTLQSTAYEPVSFVVDDLLPQGLHLLAGAPKIGKSWLALWLCLCAAQG